MGSTKKHRDRDRDRDEKHEKRRKRKHRSRSHSRERERKRERREEERAHPRREPSEEGELDEQEERRPFDTDSAISQIKQEDEGNETASERQGGSDLSLSIEETNKLRAKLGLKPLDTGEDSSTTTDKDVAKSTKKEDVHVPAINWGEKRKTEAIREKMNLAKEKRMIREKLGKVKTLGESDDEDDAVSWVIRSRRIQQEKEEAEKRAKLLEEMDEEFGIGNLVEEEFKPRSREYSSRDLKGIKVEHDLDSFKEGRTTILTLQDKGVLDDDGDVLLNVNMVDDEAAQKNVINKKKRPDYNPYDVEEVDEYGMLNKKEVLSKYNEEIQGEKKSSFALGVGGKYDASHEKMMKEMKASIREKGETLSLPPPTIAKEFYSQTEMAEKFKKVKKKVRKIRKKPKTLTALDLKPLPEDEHFGRRGKKIKEEPMDLDAPIDRSLPKEMIDRSGPIPGLEMDVDPNDPLDESEILGPEEDLTGIDVEEDKAALELQSSLSKAMKIKQKKSRRNFNIAERVAEEVEERADDGQQGLNIQLNATSEFCRSLGEIPTYGQAGNRQEEEDELIDFERELVETRRRTEESTSGWHHVEIDTSQVEIENEEKGVLDDEPVVNEGIGAALELAKKKGYLDQNMKKAANVSKHIDLAAKNYSIEDKRYDDLDDKYSRGKNRERYMGGGSEFKDKEGYKPDVKLEYVDDAGRAMTPKEAFRFLSHKFHGKGSGKKKTEKRMKKVEEEMLMKSMSSTDTPLNTVQMLLEKQKTEKTPYVVLSGTSKGSGAGSLSK